MIIYHFMVGNERNIKIIQTIKYILINEVLNVIHLKKHKNHPNSKLVMILRKY